MTRARMGFTLPETVIALSLFATASLVLYQSAINARNGLLRLDQEKPAHMRIDWVRQQLLGITNRVELETGGELEFTTHISKTPKLDEDGEIEETQDAIRVRWEAEIFPTRVLDLHQLTIAFTITSGEQIAEPITGSTYVYRPGWYEDGVREKLLAEKKEQREQANEGVNQ